MIVSLYRFFKLLTSRRGRTVRSHGCRESANKSAFGICEGKQEEKVYKFHSWNSCDMLLKTAMELRAGQRNYLNAIMSRFDATQLIYYAIKTRYTVCKLYRSSFRIADFHQCPFLKSTVYKPFYCREKPLAIGHMHIPNWYWPPLNQPFTSILTFVSPSPCTWFYIYCVRVVCVWSRGNIWRVVCVWFSFVYRGNIWHVVCVWFSLV